MTYGIDVGTSQSGLNFYTAQTQGIQFAIVKAGGANVLPLYVAPAYTNEVFKAIVVGMPVGHYWVTGAGDATAQADYFTSHLSQFDKNSQILALDNETLDSNGETWTDAKIATWINRVVANTGIDPQRIWLYMSASAVRNATTFSQTIATGCRFWVAVWGANDGTRITPDLGGKWPTWHVQQYWSTAKVDGYTTDKNYSPLSIADLFSPGPVDPGPTSTATGTLYEDSASLWEDGWSGGNTPPIGKNPLEKCVYRDGQWIIYWGTNANVPPPPPPPPSGIARLAGNGSLINGSTPPPPKPVANFTWAQTTGTFAVAFVNTSTQTAGSIVSSVWNFGDGSATSTTANPTHSYPQVTATYTVTLTVTDSFGQTATKAGSITVTSAPPPPPPPPSGAKYAIGNMYDGYSAGQTIQQNITAAGGRVYTFADLGLTTATTNLQTIVDKLPGNGVIQLPANWTGYINSFNHHGTDFGIYQARLMGLLGNITNGQITTTIKVGPNAETATQAWSLGNKDASGNYRAAKLGDTTHITAYHVHNTLPHFISGIHWQGSDQIKATDTSNNRTGPAVWAGLAFNNAGSHSIFQNCYLQGFGRADDSTPPGEVGNSSDAHTDYFLMRRLEHDGMLAHTSGATDPYGMAWRRGGGIQWNETTHMLSEDVYTHDTWASGWTASFTGVPSDTTKMSGNYTTRRLLVAHNSHHGTAPGNQTSGTFAAINMEFNYGTVHHYQPHFGIIDGGLGANKGHIQLWMAGTIAGTAYKGDPNLSVIVHQPVWENSGPQYNDCFVIRYSGLKTINGKYPTVYLTSDETKPAKVYVMSSSSTAPSTITKANNYYILTY